MSRLPFGRNPFAEPAPSAVANPSRPTASAIATQSRPDPPLPREIQERQSRKRDIVDVSKLNANKKQKNIITEDSLSNSVASTFGSVVANHFSEEDVRLLKNRNDTDAEFNFKIGLGDAFYHGLNILAQKNAIIKDLEKSTKKLKNEIVTQNTKMGKVQRKVAEDLKASQDEITKLQATFENFKLESSKASEVITGENEKLKGEVEELKASIRKAQTEAYTVGFLDHLRNFIAADPDYDWSMHFAPSTPAYMLKFKDDNVENIAAAKEELRLKIKEEKKAMAEEEARKKEMAVGDNAGMISPSNATTK